ncbi:Spo0E family sporulation regulatory protein-aspartic acid phosphatase [Paenibacillus sp. GCM10012307]|uniref:Aspartyl-phosphate phosphatase Spo0E family protein n=1 Tax=Paenibacillus roseus TaxID=2798579 RepID=A0A934J319_9BACL|nr:aspartyl-phosphate phosphatase Spo0E family protein [Paenibacillus roseus]MBJ6363857.1 aspartyl-phosphate phosphatase Spo0E family protein [Paenibacillus roseus]
MAYAGEGFSLSKDQDAVRSSNHLSPTIRRLEDEIYQLRKVMEQTYLQDSTLNSEIIIEISRKLDTKINEYMRARRIYATT